MNELAELTIKTHGGLKRWGQFESVSAHLDQGAALWIGIGGQRCLFGRDVGGAVGKHVFVGAPIQERNASPQTFG
jgi:hypothetical protein